jgi:hypothetical protein
MVSEEGSLTFEKVQQIGDLFEIRGDIRIVTAQMHVVELNINDVLDAVSELAILSSRVRSSRLAKHESGQDGDRETDNPIHLPGSPPHRYW